jgi:ABC-type nitrate/sulfonate/bicarbonate transport system ATPase subunit
VANNTPEPIEAPVRATGDASVSIRNLGVTYDNSVKAIDGFDLEVASGEFVVVLGPSGCGKSTLLMVLAGLVTPTEGQVLVSGRVNPAPGPDRGCVFQLPGLLPWFNVYTNIELGLRTKGLSKRDARHISSDLVSKFGLAGFGELYPRQLSGGMQQRVGVARAFAVDPPILLMDEPFGALDAQTRLLLQEELVRLWEGTGKTVVFVTHSIEEAIFLGDRVVVMGSRPGRVREVVDVPLPRPRRTEMRTESDYLGLYSDLWGMIRSEAEESI